MPLIIVAVSPHLCARFERLEDVLGRSRITGSTKAEDLVVCCQNYGGQPEAWALIKGTPEDPEGLWADVIRFIEQDGARPSPPTQGVTGEWA